jgi:hypothetical protein
MRSYMSEFVFSIEQSVMSYQILEIFKPNNMHRADDDVCFVLD